MGLTLVRIDDRLIHGQVVEGWLPVLKVKRVVVVSDEAAEDPMNAAMMEMCLPEDMALEVHGVAAGGAAVKRAAASPEKTLVLVPGPQEVLSFLEQGLELQSVNVGGLHYAAGTYQLGKAIFLSEDDKRALSAIAERGVALEGRAVPSDSPMDIVALIREKV